MSPRPLAVVGALLAALAASVLAPAAPAYAGVAANADTYVIYPGAAYTLDPLTNDRTTGLFPGPLSLCGLLNQSPQKLYVEQVGDLVRVEVAPGATGSVTFRYEACERSSRESGTVTLTLRRVVDVVGARKASPRGKVTFRNPNPVDVRVRWGSATSGIADAMRRVPARSTIIVATTRKSVYWIGFLMDGDTLVPAGDGTITGIVQPRRR